MANDDLVVNRVQSRSTSTPGRSINEVRQHRLVIDEPTHLGGPGEEITPADAFLAGVSACGVLLVQGRARETGIRLDRIDVRDTGRTPPSSSTSTCCFASAVQPSRRRSS